MKTVKRAAEYTILKRGDERYAVRGKDKKWINGDAKVEILVKEGLLAEQPKGKPQSEQAEAPQDESSPDASPEGDKESDDQP